MKALLPDPDDCTPTTLERVVDSIKNFFRSRVSLGRNEQIREVDWSTFSKENNVDPEIDYEKLEESIRLNQANFGNIPVKTVIKSKK